MSQPSLNELLQQTSRSFYLTLRVLPRAIRPQIGLAYLLARTTDTIADSEIVLVAQRLEALQALRERILGTSSVALNFGELAKQQGLPAERMLLERVEEALTVLRGLAETDLKLVRKVLDTITSGQELDLRRFGGTTAGNIIALQNDAELDDYTYRVAGCVGEFWTGMCREHLFRLAELDAAFSGTFEEAGVRFGKGLQLVNILRDLPADLRKGRCYLPADKLAEVGSVPADLLSPTNETKFRPLYNRYLDLAESHLAAGWDYTNLIPFTWMSLRLACAWPVLIGLETLKRLRAEPVLDPSHRVKISRADVRGIILRSMLRYPFPGAWRKLARFSVRLKLDLLDLAKRLVWRTVRPVLTMKLHRALRILLLLGWCWSGGGCVTQKLWETVPFARIHEPATPLHLELFAAKTTSDVLVRYSEWTENSEQRKPRAYWLSVNHEPQDNPHSPKFVSPKVANGLAPIPIRTEIPGVFPTNGALFAVAITNPPGFLLYAGNRQLGIYQLPVYPDASGKTMQVLLTPPAVVADVVIYGSVIVGSCFLLAWASGGLN